jgi:hypothetical protein
MENKLKKRSGTPVTDAFREWVKKPENAQQFADQGNALAGVLRIIHVDQGNATTEVEFLRQQNRNLLTALTDELIRFDGKWTCKCGGLAQSTGRQADPWDRCLVEHLEECPLYPCIYVGP